MEFTSLKSHKLYKKQVKFKNNEIVGFAVESYRDAFLVNINGDNRALINGEPFGSTDKSYGFIIVDTALSHYFTSPEKAKESFFAMHPDGIWEEKDNMVDLESCIVNLADYTINSARFTNGTHDNLLPGIVARYENSISSFLRKYPFIGIADNNNSCNEYGDDVCCAMFYSILDGEYKWCHLPRWRILNILKSVASF